MEPLNGRCLCGAVQFEAQGEPLWVGHCHCQSCRRNTASAVATFLGYRPDQVRFTKGGRSIFNSSPGVRRGFCNQCGTHLLFTYLPTGSTSFSPGLFNDARGFSMDEEIFIDAKPDYYELAGDRPRLTEAEVMEKYKPDM